MDLQFEAWLAKLRLEEARAQAARWNLAAAQRPARRPIRVALGLSLIRLGRALAANSPRPTGTVDRATA